MVAPAITVWAMAGPDTSMAAARVIDEIRGSFIFFSPLFLALIRPGGVACETELGELPMVAVAHLIVSFGNHRRRRESLRRWAAYAVAFTRSRAAWRIGSV